MVFFITLWMGAFVYISIDLKIKGMESFDSQHFKDPLEFMFFYSTIFTIIPCLMYLIYYIILTQLSSKKISIAESITLGLCSSSLSVLLIVLAKFFSYSLKNQAPLIISGSLCSLILVSLFKRTNLISNTKL